MAIKSKKYSFCCGENIRIAFNSDGNVVKACGFSFILWAPIGLEVEDVDKSLIGKHVDEVADILKKYTTNHKIYENFELSVHIPMLKMLLQQKA